MMHTFWLGFCKQASEGESPIDAWIADAKSENKRLEHPAVKKNDFDPREASEWIGPEVAHHNWPSAGR
jgi:hypothetical protein